ncbi:hypothetical protein WG947_05915 [Pontibacter sp. H259]|uniref:hypothetical protein n=1 Tax=Pontibacter sp. H259 TaxID=3133421 RepID=UPI0030C42009
METLILEDKITVAEVGNFLKLYRCEGGTILIADWSGILYPDSARLGCTTILEVLEKQPCAKILNNNSKVTGHYPGATEWVGKVWFPSMYELGVRYFAWVYSPEIYTQIGTDTIVKLSSKVEIQTFYEVVHAWQWLQTKTNA